MEWIPIKKIVSLLLKIETIGMSLSWHSWEIVKLHILLINIWLPYKYWYNWDYEDIALTMKNMSRHSQKWDSFIDNSC